MNHNIDHILSEKRDIVRELFVNTADDNYIAARWCFVERLNVDFFWLAVHALEKYMKASLLLNGHSGWRYRAQNGRFRSFSHDIEALYEQIASFSAEFLPEDLTIPEQLDTDRWLDETPRAFMRRFLRNGNADNRYQVFGYVRHTEDLFKLDLMVFALRRLCIPLDAYFLGSPRPGTTSPTYRDLLTEQTKYWALIPSCKLKKTSDGKRGDRLRDVFLNLNLPFAPDDHEHPGLRSGMESANPVLVRSVLKPLEQEPDGPAIERAVELCDWVLENIKLPRHVREEIEQAKARRQP